MSGAAPPPGGDAVIAPPASPAAATVLRDAVLEGCFFSDKHAASAADLAAFLHGGLNTADQLRAWFGAACVGLLRAGPAALRAALDRDIAAIDAALSTQLDAILHAPRLQQLEGRWRGLAWLISGIEPGRRI